jgi:hypothetical protein
MTQEQPLVVRAQGRPDGDRLPIAGVPPFPGRSGGGPGVRWVEDGTLLAVTTWGSSSHPVVPRTGWVSDGELTLTLAAPGDRSGTPDLGGPMTADTAACTTLVEPPAGLDPGVHTRVLLGGRVVDLPPAGTPPAPRIELRPMPGTPPPFPPPSSPRPATA